MSDNMKLIMERFSKYTNEVIDGEKIERLTTKQCLDRIEGNTLTEKEWNNISTYANADPTFTAQTFGNNACASVENVIKWWQDKGSLEIMKAQPNPLAQFM